MTEIMFLCWAWLLIGGILWYYLYPDSSKFPEVLFLLVWPFLIAVVIVKLMFDSFKEEKEE